MSQGCLGARLILNPFRHCERSEAIQGIPAQRSGLLRRFAPRNDEKANQRGAQGMEHLTGKVAFITGGASGIGLGMARAFLEEGMKVSLADWSDEHIAKAREQLAGSNAVHFVKTNVAERDSLRNAAQETLDAFGKIHVLCNNAGVNGGGTAASEDF